MMRPHVTEVIEKIEESRLAITAVHDASNVDAVIAAVQDFSFKINEAIIMLQPDSLTTSETEAIRAKINAAVDEANAATLVAYLSISHPDDYEKLILESRIPNI